MKRSTIFSVENIDWSGFVKRLISAVHFFFLLLISSSVWSAEGRSIEDFYGEFVGHVVTNNDGKEIDRDLSVSIRPAKQEGRFLVKWATVIRKASGKLKRKVYNIKFARTHRTNIYSSAMKKNVFGGSVALDPLKGDPFVWARIKGDTLTVHALIISDDGGYQMQIYDRTLNDEGLMLNYVLKDRGNYVKKISTQLVRVAD